MDGATLHRYCATNRPVGFATVPPGYVAVEGRPAGGDGRALARQGVVVYARRLSEQESVDFELAPILSEGERTALAGEIVAECAEYRDGIEEMLVHMPAEVSRSILQRVERRYRTGVCLGDRDAFVARVLLALGMDVSNHADALAGATP